jgi:lactoylglutathione lyase
MQLSLLVIKSHQIEQLKQFYEKLGLNFQEEKHGTGPVHYSALIQNTVFEIYPLPLSIEIADTTTRLGFHVENLDILIQHMKAIGIQVINDPKSTQWGYLAMVKDPDGRSIELTQIT